MVNICLVNTAIFVLNKCEVILLDRLYYKGYTGSIHKEDGYFYGEVLGMSLDLMTYEAETLTGLETSFHECIDLYLDACEKRGLVIEISQKN